MRLFDCFWFADTGVPNSACWNLLAPSKELRAFHSAVAGALHADTQNSLSRSRHVHFAALVQGLGLRGVFRFWPKTCRRNMQPSSEATLEGTLLGFMVVEGSGSIGVMIAYGFCVCFCFQGVNLVLWHVRKELSWTGSLAAAAMATSVHLSRGTATEVPPTSPKP